MPRRRQAGATSTVSSRPVGQGERRDADDVSTDPGDDAAGGLVVLDRGGAGWSPCCAPSDSARVRSAATRECSVALHFSGCGPSSFSITVGSGAGVVDDVVRRGEPARRLVDQVVSGAGFDAHLVPACTTHELGDRPRGPVLRRTDHQLIGDPAEVGKDLQAQDVQAGISTSGGEQRESSRAFGQRRTHSEEHAATVIAACCAMDSPLFRACQQTGRDRQVDEPRRVVQWSGGRGPSRLRRGAPGGVPAPRGTPSRRLRRTAPDRSRPDELPTAHRRGDARAARGPCRATASSTSAPALAWTTALLAELTGPTGSVLGVELVPELVRWGRREPRPDGVHLGLGAPGGAGACSAGRRRAPYDRILVSADAPSLPHALVDQLAEDGRIVVPVRGTMMLGIRTGSSLETSTHGSYRFVPLL